MQSDFTIPIRVYYEDTDAGGVVYYANYLKFMERARTEWLRSLGLEQDHILQKEGIVFAVRSVQLDFVKPARFNDSLVVSLKIDHVGKASLVFKQQVLHNDTVLCHGLVKIACIHAETFSPSPIPAEISARITSGVLQEW